MEFVSRIIKATGGFYYVKSPNGEVIECRARGLFRKEQLTPYVGDFATVETEKDSLGYITAIGERKNFLIRPPVANLDYMVYIMSSTEPVPNTVTTDTFLSVLEDKNIDVIIVLTKSDLEDAEEYRRIYTGAGYKVYSISSEDQSSMEALLCDLAGKFCAFSGNSGVGKSSLLNRIDSKLGLITGEISTKLGRGRHTTRHVEVFEAENGIMIADTPGFSSLDIVKMSSITKEDLALTFRDFAPFAGKCKFRNCMHIGEKGCEIISRVDAGEISRSRYGSYITIYNGIKDIKGWEK